MAFLAFPHAAGGDRGRGEKGTRGKAKIQGAEPCEAGLTVFRRRMQHFFHDFPDRLLSSNDSALEQYTIFTKLLDYDRRCHELLAEIEDLYYQRKKTDINAVRRLFEDLSHAVSTMITCLNSLSPDSSMKLRERYTTLDISARALLSPPRPDVSPPYILPLDGRYENDRQVGGKGFYLARLRNRLSLPVPLGFVISTSAYNTFLEANDLAPGIRELLSGLDGPSPRKFHDIGARLQHLVEQADIPPALAGAILAGARDLSPPLALRSSAVSEVSRISFAGQYRTMLRVEGKSLLTAYKKVLASKFSPPALYYRIANGLFDHATPMAVLVMEMVDARVSGVITSQDPTRSDPDTMTIHSLAGPGELLVSGRLCPEVTIISKNKRRIIGRTAAPAAPAADDGCLSPEKALILTDWTRRIEEYYRCPQEIEWCLDGHDRLHLLQTRPLIIQQQAQPPPSREIERLPLLLEGGETASGGISCGRIFHLENENQLHTVPRGAILVTTVTPPSYVRIMDRLAGVLALHGSVADHFSSVAREFGVPMLVKTDPACRHLASGQEVTLWADRGRVYSGRPESGLPAVPPCHRGDEGNPFSSTLARIMKIISPLTLINPDQASFSPERCRSFHDIIRFAHEMGVQTIFARPLMEFDNSYPVWYLKADLPIRLYVADVGGGVTGHVDPERALRPSHLRCVPLLALLQGMHRGLDKSERGAGPSSISPLPSLNSGTGKEKTAVGCSYAVLTADYLHLLLRFSYHFALIDSLCSPMPGKNYIFLRFAGGGAGSAGKALRLNLIDTILQKYDFSTTHKGDLLDARLMAHDPDLVRARLTMIGRLLISTRLLDMHLMDGQMVERMATDFLRD